MAVETYNIISIIVTCLGFVLTFVGILFVYRQLVSAAQDRETDILVRLYSISSREPLSEDFTIIWNMEPQLHEDHPQSCLRVCLFFEMIGSLTSEEYIDTVLLEEFFGSLVIVTHQNLSCYIKSQRGKPFNENFAINFERLASTMQRSTRASQNKPVLEPNCETDAD